MCKPTTLVSPDRRLISTAELAEHEGLVRWVVSRQRLRGLPFEDAVQAGRIGLWHALQGYDPARGARFSTYAVVAISRAVWRAISEHQPRAPLGSGGLHLPMAEFPDLAEVVHRRQIHAELVRLVGTLPTRLRQVIVAHYGLEGLPPQTFATIGQALGVTRQRVQQLHVEAVLWLAQPKPSLTLRRLLDRGQRRDYQHALARQRRWRQVRRASRSRAR